MAGNDGFPIKKEGRQALDELLIAAFMVGSTHASAAEFAKCSETTIRRKLKNPTFQAKLAEARRELVSRTVRRAATYALEALTTLRDLSKGSEDDGVRLRASVALLEASANLHAIEEFDERLERLENGRRGDGERTIRIA
jgi:hypothetical protein